LIVFWLSVLRRKDTINKAAWNYSSCLLSNGYGLASREYFSLKSEFIYGRMAELSFIRLFPDHGHTCCHLPDTAQG